MNISSSLYREIQAVIGKDHVTREPEDLACYAPFHDGLEARLAFFPQYARMLLAVAVAQVQSIFIAVFATTGYAGYAASGYLLGLGVVPSVYLHGLTSRQSSTAIRAARRAVSARERSGWRHHP